MTQIRYYYCVAGCRFAKLSDNKIESIYDISDPNIKPLIIVYLNRSDKIIPKKATYLYPGSLMIVTDGYNYWGNIPSRYGFRNAFTTDKVDQTAIPDRYDRLWLCEAIKTCLSLQ